MYAHTRISHVILVLFCGMSHPRGFSVPSLLPTVWIAMNDNDGGHDALKYSGNSNAEDDLVCENIPTSTRGDEDRHEHRKGRRIWLGVGMGVLLLAIMFGILISTVILNHDTSSANVEAVQQLNTERVRC
jgi:hypothetical protein